MNTLVRCLVCWGLFALLGIAIFPLAEAVAQSVPASALPDLAPTASLESGVLEEETLEYEFGVEVQAGPLACRGLVLALPVPMDWPEEQTVKILQKQVQGPLRRERFRTLDRGVRQWVLQVGTLPAGGQFRARLVVQIHRRRRPLPEDVHQWKRPARPTRHLRRYLGKSPQIETTHPRIKSLSRKLAVEADSDWKLVQRYYDWVRENITYRQGPLKGALKALEDGTGDCEEMTSLFVALCRAAGVPARSVWVPGHSYAEFYLESPQGKGRWFPCQLAGTRAFGTLWEPRPVLQKGDRFRVPELRRTVRYVSEYAYATRGQPRVQFFRRRLSSAEQEAVESTP